jgi:hypothetical protein
MTGWFFNLEPSNQALLISAAISAVVIGIVAFLGFWITFKTSTAANREIARVTQAAKLDELRHLTRLKLADYRMQWIEALRSEASNLYRVQYEITQLRRLRSKRNEQQNERLLELYYESSALKSRMLMRIKKETDEPNEREIERLLKKAVNSDAETAIQNRRELRERFRTLFKTEWMRVRSEVEVLQPAPSPPEVGCNQTCVRDYF